MVIPFARSLTLQTARKVSALKGCNKNARSQCCAPWHRRMTTTCVARLAIIPFLLATRFMADLIRGSLDRQPGTRFHNVSSGGHTRNQQHKTAAGSMHGFNQPRNKPRQRRYAVADGLSGYIHSGWCRGNVSDSSRISLHKIDHFGITRFHRRGSQSIAE